MLKMLHFKKKNARGVIGQGITISFWHDNWGQGTFKDRYTELFCFSSKANLTVQEFIQTTDTLESFHIPLSPHAHQQFQEIHIITQEV